MISGAFFIIGGLMLYFALVLVQRAGWGVERDILIAGCVCLFLAFCGSAILDIVKKPEKGSGEED